MGKTLNLKLSAAMLMAGALILALAGSVAAAPTSPGDRATGYAQLTTGVICGSVTAYTAPTVSTAGSITIAGTTDPVAAGASVSPEATAALSATLPLTTCLNLTVSGGEVTAIAIATSGQLCGAVTATGTGDARVYSIGGAVLPATTTLDAQLRALLDAAIAANATVCVDLTVDATTGAVTAVANLDATFLLCGAVTATGSGDARTYTVAGLAIPAAQLSAAERAALELAIVNNVNACVDLVIVDSQITSATARVDACVTVGAVTATSVTLDGVAIPIEANATVADEIEAGATLGVRVAIDATTGAVTLSAVTLEGCVASGVGGEGGGAAPSADKLPNASVPADGGTAPAFVGLALLGLAGSLAMAARRREHLAA